MEHSKKLEETKLWKVYIEKAGEDHNRIGWTKKVCEDAFEYLKAVRDTFKNYTLHDETHVLNVMDVMAGLLGNKIADLIVGEVELLLLAAALHDIGMVYDHEDIEKCLSDKVKLEAFFSTHPDLQDVEVKKWDELAQQNYLRWLHPYRVAEVLKKEIWQKHFENKPIQVVPENVIAAVCQAHGESPTDVRRKAIEGNLKYIDVKDVDPLFCAIMLRLADILDFDDSRAPSVLFFYAGVSEKSIEEWKKHMGSMGFRFPSEPNYMDLPYGAVFSDPNIERTARAFLDWIDEELLNARELIKHTNGNRKNFPLPYQVKRDEIERVDYDYGDFIITMDQKQIMKLLIGEELYTDQSVFIRELLQNSMENSFNV